MPGTPQDLSSTARTTSRPENRPKAWQSVHETGQVKVSAHLSAASEFKFL
jgi:hypothetical protein